MRSWTTPPAIGGLPSDDPRTVDGRCGNVDVAAV